jgi:hypothetical protein
MSELSSEARALLREARSFDEPNAADAQRVRASVLTKVGIAVGAGAAVTAAAPSLAARSAAVLGATVLKVGAAIVVAAGLATASYVALRSPAVEPTSAVVATERTPQSTLEMPAPAIIPTALPEVEPRAAPPPPNPAKTARSRSPVPPIDRAPRVPRTTPDLEGEARLLEQADADLRRGDANAALARLAEHAAQYPGGALREEREGVRVVALCRAGRQEEGKVAAERFLARSPRSALVPRIRAACGD